MATKRIKKSDIYGGSTYPDEKKYYQFMDQERKDSKKQEKMKIGEGDTVKFTKPRKNEYDEWNSKMYVNGKVYRPAEIFASDKEDAQIQIDNAKAIYKKHGATILEDVEASKNVLRENIMQLSGVSLNEEEKYKVSLSADDVVLTPKEEKRIRATAGYTVRAGDFAVQKYKEKKAKEIEKRIRATGGYTYHSADVAVQRYKDKMKKEISKEDVQLSGANVTEKGMTEYDSKDVVDLIDFVKFVNYNKNMIIGTESPKLKKDFEMYLADALTAIKNIKELARKSGDRV